MEAKVRETIVARLGVVVLLCAIALNPASADEGRQGADQVVGEACDQPLDKGTRKKRRKASAERPKHRTRAKSDHIAAAIKHLNAAGLHEFVEELTQIQNRQRGGGDLSRQLERIEHLVERRFDKLSEKLERKIDRKLDDLETDIAAEEEVAEGGEKEGEEPAKKPG